MYLLQIGDITVNIPGMSEAAILVLIWIIAAIKHK